jgi:peptide/nickel transport system permease protein
VTRLGTWIPYLGRRLFATVTVLFVVGTITFFVTHLIANPVALLVGTQATPEIKRQLTHELGLDKPLYVQYVAYLSHAARGDFGYSTHTFNPVTTDLRLRLPATLELVLAAFIIVTVIGVPLGVFAGANPGGISDRVARTVSQLGASVPNFWVGLILIYLLYYEWHLFPAPLGRIDDSVSTPRTITGLLTVDSLLAGNMRACVSALGHLVLPAITLSLVALPSTILITRNTMTTVLESDFVRTARAYGMPWRKLYFGYALRNVLGAVLTVLAMTFGFLMGSTVLVETVFAWPGIGLYAVDSMNSSDYAPLVAIVLVAAAFYALAYLVSDLLHAAVDPRVRIQK